MAVNPDMRAMQLADLPEVLLGQAHSHSDRAMRVNRLIEPKSAAVVQ
jgi:hypothetical protein